MLRWGKQETTPSMSPDEAEKAFCFVGFFSQTNEAVKSLFSVGGNQKHYDHPPPHPPPPPKEQEQLMQTADEGKRSTAKTKRLKSLWRFKKQKKTQTSNLWGKQSTRNLVRVWVRATVVTPLSGRAVKKWHDDKSDTVILYRKSLLAATQRCIIASIACHIIT